MVKEVTTAPDGDSDRLVASKLGRVKKKLLQSGFERGTRRVRPGGIELVLTSLQSGLCSFWAC